MYIYVYILYTSLNYPLRPPFTLLCFETDSEVDTSEPSPLCQSLGRISHIQNYQIYRDVFSFRLTFSNRFAPFDPRDDRKMTPKDPQDDQK